jgi:hypothetical protein
LRSVFKVLAITEALIWSGEKTVMVSAMRKKYLYSSRSAIFKAPLAVAQSG